MFAIKGLVSKSYFIFFKSLHMEVLVLKKIDIDIFGEKTQNGKNVHNFWANRLNLEYWGYHAILLNATRYSISGFFHESVSSKPWIYN